jgi:MFS family permease
MAAGPAGSLIGYVLLPRLVPERQRRRTTALTAAACGLSMAFCPLAVGSASATLALLALSGAFSAYLIAAMPWFVQEVPNEMRGRVVGFGQGGLLIAQGALSMGAGVLAGAASPQAATATAGIALAVVALLLHRPVAAAVEPEPSTAVVPAVHPEASPS